MLPHWGSDFPKHQKQQPGLEKGPRTEGTPLKIDVSKAQSYEGTTDVVFGSGQGEYATQGDQHRQLLHG